NVRSTPEAIHVPGGGSPSAHTRARIPEPRISARTMYQLPGMGAGPWAQDPSKVTALPAMYRYTYTKPSESYVTSYRSGVDSEPRRITPTYPMLPPSPRLERNVVSTSTSALGMSTSARTW